LAAKAVNWRDVSTTSSSQSKMKRLCEAIGIPIVLKNEDDREDGRLARCTGSQFLEVESEAIM
jgi:hypothetical protein